MRDIGKQFELQAARWLQEQGWQVVARNYLTPMGEIDIIALHGATLVFVEVKARSSRRHAGAAAAVSRAKQTRLLRTARAFLSRHPAMASAWRRPKRF